MELGAVILAAGQGTRMRSAWPKVLHPLLGEPMVRYSLRMAQDVGARPVALVVGHGADQVREATADFEVVYVLQEEQLGTGHAVLQARSALDGQAGTVLVFYADMPLLRAETVQAVVARHREAGATLTLLTVEQDDSMGFGRVVRDAEGRVQAIVEERDCTPAQRAIRELNCGVYAFQAAWLWENLPRLERNPRKGEYYLTDLVAMAAAQGEPIAAVQTEDVEEVLGINTRVHLAQAEAVLRRRVNERWMLAGVTLVDQARTYIQATVTIGRDTVIWPD
ncbi:MAG: bifunctional N-acetylglucosamine-1-phosphate uridyltransferase/glucosamine-1-phosphate acetyltransferase, partial [Anaerolineae bacterium]|nr:bifunctional N-acetylglucosamine-1-phosphate uridyltransferase/glucosamine-1-phosphate acetyltransferase [Anaerolineae bacterium]